MRKTKAPSTYFFRKVIKIPMYSGNFIILFSNDIKKVCKTVNIKEEFIDELYGHTFHNFLYGGYESFCICLNFWSDEPITTGTIIHEVTHAGNRLLMSRDFKEDWMNDEAEAEAYLKGWMADEIEKFMRQCKIV